MAETDYLQEFKSFFLPGDPNDPRVNPDLRKRIALAMMARQRKAPQNIGEGLNAIGEAIGDVRAQRRLEEQDIAQTEKLKGLTAAVEGAGVDTAPAVAVPTGTGVVSRAALAPPVTGVSTEPFVPPPPPPVTRSAGVPSPLPPDTTGAMPQPAPQQMITPMGTNTIAPPSGALPGSPRDMDPRARAAYLLAARQRGITPPNPPPAGAQTPAPTPPLAPPTGGPSPVPMSQGPGGDPEFSSQNRPNPAPGIQPAPPEPRLVRPEPPGEPTPPGQVPLTPVQQRAIATARQHPQDADVQRVMKDLYDREEVKRTFQQGILNKQYEHKLKMADPQYQATLSKTRSEANKEAEASEIVRRTGMVPNEFFKRMDEEKTGVDLTLRAQNAQQLARKAIKDGVITGYGANMRVTGAKFADWAWNNGLQGDLAANTEIMQAALTAGLSEAIKTINGEGGAQVSNTDVKIAQGMAGTDPNLQMKTIQSIMDRAAAINHRKIDRYEEKVSRYLGGHQAEQMYETGAKPAAEPEHIKEFMEIQRASPAKAAIAKERFDREHGPGAFDLEMARHRRAQRQRR